MRKLAATNWTSTCSRSRMTYSANFGPRYVDFQYETDYEGHLSESSIVCRNALMMHVLVLMLCPRTLIPRLLPEAVASGRTDLVELTEGVVSMCSH